MVMLEGRTDVDAQLVERADAIYSVLERPAAREVAEKLIGEAPDLVNEWVSRHLAALLTDFLGKRWRARTNRSHIDIARGVFAEVAREYEQTLGVFETPMAVEGGHRVEVGELTAADHRFLASRHRVYAKANKNQAAFHEAVAKRLGQKITREVFTEEQYVELRDKYVQGEE